MPDFFDNVAPEPVVHKCPACDQLHTADPLYTRLIVCRCSELLEIYEEGIYWVGNQAVPQWAGFAQSLRRI